MPAKTAALAYWLEIDHYLPMLVHGIEARR
jgi:hypothetical protein